MLKTALGGQVSWCGTTCSTESHRSTPSVSDSGSPTGSFTRQVGISHTDTFVPNDDDDEREELDPIRSAKDQKQRAITPTVFMEVVEPGRNHRG